MLATCCSIEPSVWVKTMLQLASTLAQASSKPFFTACQKVFEADEWCVKTMFSPSARACRLCAERARAKQKCCSQFFHFNSSLWIF